MISSPDSVPSSLLLPQPGTRVRAASIVILVIAPLIIAAVGLLLGQSVIWDLRNYHWYNAFALVTGRYAAGTDFAPSQIEFFHNPALDVPFYWLATHLPVKAAFFILSAVQGLNFCLLFMLAHALLPVLQPRMRALAACSLAALGMAGGMGISEFGAPFYDNVASLGVLLSLLLVVARREELKTAHWRRAAWLVLLAGLPVGIAAGLKLTTAVFCVGLCGAFPASMRLSERGILLGFFFGLGVLAGFAAAYGYWGCYLYSHYDSPMFPYFNRLFHSPYVAPVYIEDYSAPHGLLAPLIYPFLFAADPMLVNEIPFRDWRIAILYALMIATGIALLVRRGNGIGESKSYLLCAAALSYLVWISVEADYRYLLPLEMLAPLLIVVCVSLFPLSARIRAYLAMGLLALIAVTVKPAQWERRVQWSDRIAKITRPAIADPAHTMILMAGNDAYAYMIPEFPPEISFVRLESRGMQLSFGWGVNDLVRSRIEKHKGPLLLLTPAREMKVGRQALAYFDLKEDEKKCRPVTDDIAESDSADFPKFYKLCDVKRR